jgi:glycosyltransferase involved in cell wall biosynthesis
MIGGVQRPREREHVAHLRRLAGQLGIAGRVRFAGERADVERLLAAADIYCQPNSRPEGFGIALVEALLARLPVVTTALGGALEVIGREAALLVDPADAGGQPLADAIARLLADDGLRRALGDAGHDRARRLTDVPTQLQHLDAVLSEAISTHSRRSRHIA